MHFAAWTAEGVELTEEQKKAETITFVMPANNVTLTFSYEVTPINTDKSLLQKTYDYAITLDTTGVTESAAENLEKLSDISDEENKSEEPNSKPENKTDSPKTGDQNTFLWISMMLALTAGYVVFYLRKRKAA